MFQRTFLFHSALFALSEIILCPDAKYFGLGKITDEQVKDISERKGKSFEEMER
jgi:hypothetical protein